MIYLAQLRNPVLPDALGGGMNPQPDAGSKILGNLISSFIGIALIGAFLMAFVFLLLGGLQWITSGGDKNALEQARDKIMNAFIGLIIVASTWAITQLVGNFLGINIANLPIPTMTGQ